VTEQPGEDEGRPNPSTDPDAQPDTRSEPEGRPAEEPDYETEPRRDQADPARDAASGAASDAASATVVGPEPVREAGGEKAGSGEAEEVGDQEGAGRGHRLVEETMARLGDLRDRPVGEHGEVYADLHDRLQTALTEGDSADGAADGFVPDGAETVH
jgi:hypothetical protein